MQWTSKPTRRLTPEEREALAAFGRELAARVKLRGPRKPLDVRQRELGGRGWR